MTDIYEGSIIRALRREIELIKQLVDASKSLVIKNWLINLKMY